MILGLGIDLVELKRIQHSYERFGQKFAEKILRPDELTELPAGTQAIAFLAARFAAKEAAVKALGTGFRDGIWFQDFSVQKDELGQPSLKIYGTAQKVFERLGATNIHLSLTHERNTAAAVVILEK